ncbi:hypothetical protein [Ahrensia sp. R2A130]|uniref:hypothetical protein n=1 Tax=Ahrensia sp. R2A130 TaxID=744979 RepID=UPI0001E0B4D1|nr:hypothetical protein [Ahrensia sp. R2A130]EFL88715.1 sodium/proline symporter [Ahrensia sp. R2A130]
MVEGTVFLLAILGIPSVLALLVAGGQWRAILYAWMVWLGLLFLVFGLGASRLDDVLHGVLLYIFFFSVIVVPVLTMFMRLAMWAKSRFKPQPS